MGTAGRFYEHCQIADADVETTGRRLYFTRPEYRGRGLPGELRSVPLVGIRIAARTGHRRGNLKARRGALNTRSGSRPQLTYSSARHTADARRCHKLNVSCEPVPSGLPAPAL